MQGFLKPVHDKRRLLLMLPLFSTLVFAQNGSTKVEATDDTATFRSGVVNVRIDAQVVRENELVTNLTAADFEIFDEGAAQKITYFGREAEPLSLVILLDVSGSMKRYLEQVAAVARQSLRYLQSKDQVAVMVFARNSAVRLSLSSDFDRVATEIRSAVWDESLGSGTNINDALAEAARYLDTSAPENGRRAVLILTDNLGLNYRRPDDEIIQSLNSANAVLNAIVVGKGEKPEVRPGVTYRNPDFSPPDVFKIADETGGEAVKVDRAGSAFSRMIERIRTRYAIHFNKPPDATAGFRKVRVELTADARMRHPGATVRARRGYFVRN
ncbi:MAG TPA: VWA domain-containing protein [Bryobacteraceae bacterium]|nr:VWA domain-containing protein [Bryobacteraceae bacterium]